MLIKESPYQTIEVSPKKPISQQEVTKLLQIARRTRSYVKFVIYGTKYYIMVTFHRNGTTNIQSNIRFDSYFQKQLYWLESRGYAEYKWAYFISEWINRFANRNFLK